LATATEHQQFLDDSLAALARGEHSAINFEQHQFDEQQSASVQSLKLLHARLEEVVQQNQTFAKGIVSLDIEKRSGNDAVYDSFAQHHQMQQGVVKILDDVSVGNFNVSVEKKHRDDQLGAALAQIINNLREVVRQTDVIAKGDYSADIQPRSDKDVLGKALASMTQTLREASEVCGNIATGDTSRKVQSKGAQDQLAAAINQIVDTLNGASTQADIIAQGDYTAEIKPRGDKDGLGKALAAMTQTLREAGQVTEAVASGDFSRKLEVKGARDLFARSLNRMVDNLTGITRQANDIALGDYSAEVAPLSDKDQLGQALFDMTRSLRNVGSVTQALAQSDFSRRVEVKGERDLLAKSMNSMVDNLQQMNSQSAREDWIKTGHAQLADQMRGDLDLDTLTEKVITHLAKYSGSHIGVFYLADEARNLTLASSYAYQRRKHLSDSIAPGEGIVGQAVKEKQLISIANVPKDYISVNSGLGEAAPCHLVVLPLVVEGSVKGAIELGFFGEFSDQTFELFERISESIAVAINSARDRTQMQDLLEEAQRSTEELQSQQEELRAANEELQEQTETIQRSEQELKTQQEQLQATNEELEEKTQYLEQQKDDIVVKNQAIEASKAMLEEKAKDLESSSKYKSEFLANMSHELRTPLNSLLILAKMLKDNKEGNLTPKQVESAQIIHNGGHDLLNLINDILDLSKVEAGQMSLNIERIPPASIGELVQGQFQHLADAQAFDFHIDFASDLPATIETDSQRCLQILKNLLSNAFKFTRQGNVCLSAFLPGSEVRFQQPQLNAGNCIGFAVTDTGIGIAPDKLRSIFEAFQQADGSTSRDYGGTGLGLTISRNLCALLGGEIQVESQPDRGSRFVIYLPLQHPSERVPINTAAAHVAATPTTHTAAHTQATPPASLTAPVSIPVGSQPPLGNGQFVAPPGASLSNNPIPIFVSDDRESIGACSQSVLIVEDDRDFACVLKGIAQHKDYLCLVAGDGKSALQLAQAYSPSAILLDLGLPDIDGLKLLELFKQDLNTRHIPVHVITGREDLGQTLSHGAVGFLKKPTGAEELNQVFATFDRYLADTPKRLLLIEDNDDYRHSLQELLQTQGLTITEAATGEAGLQLLREQAFDCVILDIGLPDMSGEQMLKHLSENKDRPLPPIIVNTGKELTEDEYRELNRYTNDIIIKGTDSTERLLDEVTLFLHQAESSLPASQRKTLKMLHDDDSALNGHKVLMVDDDLRNTFALSNLLETRGLEVLVAENGQQALDMLAQHADIELVLMDIMMPVMDGFEAMEKIRAQDKFKNLPIIALTAKAMSEDKSKCLAAGANDYMNKPVDSDKLLALLKVNLHQ